jgi:hypothetical protein
MQVLFGSSCVHPSCFSSPAFKCRPSAWWHFGQCKCANGSMRSGLTGGWSLIAGVAFGMIFSCIVDPQVGQSVSLGDVV